MGSAIAARLQTLTPLLVSLDLGKTQPFDDNLHQRVLKYQNDLFDAREINARERVDAPARTAQVNCRTDFATFLQTHGVVRKD